MGRPARVRHDRRRRRSWRGGAVVMGLTVWLAACGGNEDPGGDGPLDLGSAEEQAGAGGGDASSPGPGASAGSTASDDGDCDLISEAEVAQLLADRFVEASRSGQGPRGAGCHVTLQASEGAEAAAASLVVQIGPADAAQMWLDMIDDLPDAREVDLGLGGVLQGRTTLDVLVDEDRSLRIGASLVLIDAATGESIFDDGDAYIDEVSDNLLGFAETLIGRL